jgi:hypothetical protein
LWEEDGLGQARGVRDNNMAGFLEKKTALESGISRVENLTLILAEVYIQS